MHSLLRRHPIFKRHHQATRETLQRYRDVAPLCIWVVVLSYPVGMFLYVSGLPFLVVVALFAVVTSAAVFYFFHLREQVDKADVLCPWEGEEDE